MEYSDSIPDTFPNKIILPDEVVRNATSEEVITISSGNFARVVRISQIAIKIYSPQAKGHHNIEKRIYERIGIHPFILQYFGETPVDSIVGRGLMFEYHHLGTLAFNLEYVTPLPSWPFEATEAIRYIHSRGVIHGDIGLHNFLVADTHNLVLADFGGSSIDGSPCLVMASIRYIAPSYMENMTGNPTVKHDIFALGTVLYEISSGRPLNYSFTDYQIRELFMKRNFPFMNTDIFGVADVVEKCWMEEYNNAEEVEDDLVATSASLK